MTPVTMSSIQSGISVTSKPLTGFVSLVGLRPLLGDGLSVSEKASYWVKSTKSVIFSGDFLLLWFFFN